MKLIEISIWSRRHVMTTWICQRYLRRAAEHQQKIKNTTSFISIILCLSICKSNLCYRMPQWSVLQRKAGFLHLRSSSKMTNHFPSPSFAGTAKYLTSAIDHPLLVETNSASIRSFLLAYDQHSSEIEQRAKQLSATMSISAQTSTTVNIKFSCDIKWV